MRCWPAGGAGCSELVGAPGSGRYRRLALALLQAFPGRAQVVPMDGFHLANVELQPSRPCAAARARPIPSTAPASSRAAAAADGQREGDIVYAPEFRREIEEPVAGAIAVLPETRLVITEGNYLLLDDGPWAGAASGR